MDRIERAWFDLKFEVSYLRSRGDAFQELFANIMGRCHPNDFIKVRPWGTLATAKTTVICARNGCCFSAMPLMK